MEELNLEKFSPKKAELIKLADGYKNLVIKDIKDKVGYEKVDNARKELGKIRVDITKTGKGLRAEAIKFQKAVIDKEKEFVAVIEPVEKDLKVKQQVIDEEKEKIVRKIKLPERKLRLDRIGVKFEDDFILLMDDNRFNEFFNEKNTEYLEEIARKAEEDRLKLESEKKDLEDKKRLEIEKEKAREDERKQALEDTKLAQKLADKKREDDIRAVKEKADKEKQDLIDEQKAKEKARVEEDEREKQIKADAEAKIKWENEQLEKQKKYQKFLKDNGYTEVTKDNYIIQKEDDKVILFKKVDELIIN